MAVRSGGQNFLLPLGQSGEIFPLSRLQPVPYVKEWFKGVINVRGNLLGVVHLLAFLEAEAGTAPPIPTASTADSSVVTLNELLEVNCALQVDSLAGLRGAEAFRSAEPPDAEAPTYFGNRFTDSDGATWQEINLRALAQSPRFLTISA